VREFAREEAGDGGPAGAAEAGPEAGVGGGPGGGGFGIERGFGSEPSIGYSGSTMIVFPDLNARGAPPSPWS
jgi:hypothetical protein